MFNRRRGLFKAKGLKQTAAAKSGHEYADYDVNDAKTRVILAQIDPIPTGREPISLGGLRWIRPYKCCMKSLGR